MRILDGIRAPKQGKLKNGQDKSEKKLNTQRVQEKDKSGEIKVGTSLEQKKRCLPTGSPRNEEEETEREDACSTSILRVAPWITWKRSRTRLEDAETPTVDAEMKLLEQEEYDPKKD